jgi:hypothetical protein
MGARLEDDEGCMGRTPVVGQDDVGRIDEQPCLS